MITQFSAVVSKLTFYLLTFVPKFSICLFIYLVPVNHVFFV